MKRTIYIGWDPRETDACDVARRSLLRHLTEPIPVKSLVLGELQSMGLYTRPTSRTFETNPRLIDQLSIREDYAGYMATEHAIARFFVPILHTVGWALFTDGDVLFRGDVARVFHGLDPSKAVYCVKHDYRPSNTVKMDAQVQSVYRRKNWSSFMLFNCQHPSHAKLTLDYLNSVPGRDLHAFSWLADDEIGELPVKYNYLVGHYRRAEVGEPVVVHFTEGLPSMAGYERVEFADEWWAAETEARQPSLLDNL